MDLLFFCVAVRSAGAASPTPVAQAAQGVGAPVYQEVLRLLQSAPGHSSVAPLTSEGGTTPSQEPAKTDLDAQSSLSNNFAQPLLQKEDDQTNPAPVNPNDPRPKYELDGSQIPRLIEFNSPKPERSSRGK